MPSPVVQQWNVSIVNGLNGLYCCRRSSLYFLSDAVCFRLKLIFTVQHIFKRIRLEVLSTQWSESALFWIFSGWRLTSKWMLGPGRWTWCWTDPGCGSGGVWRSDAGTGFKSWGRNWDRKVSHHRKTKNMQLSGCRTVNPRVTASLLNYWMILI